MRVIKMAAAGIGLIGMTEALAGCAEVLVPGTMAAGGEYYRYTTSHKAKGTLMGDVRQITDATQSALKKMNIRLHSVAPYTNETVMYIYFYAETRLEDKHYWGGADI
ncbi:MAG: hypothetical protein PVI71_00445 [Desulfobacterales bacterium]|jgi:hypothetical protein